MVETRELLPPRKIRGKKRLAARPLVEIVLRDTWCRGASEDETRAALAIEARKSGFSGGYRWQGWWTEARDRTGWLSTREKKRALKAATKASLVKEPFNQDRSEGASP